MQDWRLSLSEGTTITSTGIRGRSHSSLRSAHHSRDPMAIQLAGLSPRDCGDRLHIIRVAYISGPRSVTFAALTMGHPGGGEGEDV